MKALRVCFPFIVAVCFGLAMPFAAWAQGDFDDVEIKTLPVADGIYMLMGQGGNIGVSVGEDGAFIIDDQYAPLVPKIKAAIGEISEKPVEFVINTHWHGDHTGGNEIFGGEDATIVAHENVRKRLKAGAPASAGRSEIPPAPEAALPVVTFADGVTFHWNDQTIRVQHVDPAHTDGDSIIIFKEANVVHMGDNYFNGFYPFIDAASGGDIRGMIDNVTEAAKMMDADTKVIPGHGPLSNKEELLAFRDMLQTSADRIEKLKNDGKSVDEIVAAEPTAELDEKWGKGFMSPERWVRVVYSTL